MCIESLVDIHNVTCYFYRTYYRTYWQALLASISSLIPINHFTHHIPSSQNDGPRPDVATSATPGGVQSVSSWLKVMHVLHKRRKKHRELVVEDTILHSIHCSQQSVDELGGGTPTQQTDEMRDTAITTHGE